MRNRSLVCGVDFSAVKLNPEFPVTHPSHLLRGEISDVPPHVHDCLEIGYCFEGSGIFTVEDKILEYGSGDAVVINHREVHQAVSSFGKISIWSFINLDPIGLLAGYVPPDEYPIESESLCGPAFINVIKAEEHEEICSVIRDIIAELRTENNGYHSVVRSLISILLVRLHRLNTSSKNPDSDNLRRELIVKISPAIRYIANHFPKPIFMDQVAATCFLSPSHFRRVFREATGFPPSEYLIKFRMNAAAIMLKNSDKRIIDIALSCGYPTLSNFNRHFQENFHCAPRDFRQNRKS